MSQIFGRNFLIMLATALVAAAIFYVLREHWAHALGVVPYLLFLACPPMHLFMHRGHKHSGGENAAKATKKQQSSGCH